MVKVIKHPLLQHKLSIIRKSKTPHWLFKDIVNEIATLMAFEVYRNLETKPISIETPVTKTQGEEIVTKILVVSILRAGLSMVEGMRTAFPMARIGHIGLERNEDTFQAQIYYFKVPENYSDATVILVDPMLATGGSSLQAINFLKKKGFTKITFVCLLATKAGIEIIEKAAPDVNILTLAIDPILTDKKYISPGLGDAGDRYFGTN